MRCQRCHKETNCYTTSMFNTQDICMKCADKEKQHPDYKLAVEADRAAVSSGNWNFEGIGLPSDLR